MNMTDPDIPSVPVTTLACLTSLSDLLSELPVPDTLASVTSLNKSLLFHTLVAKESNNLLSVRDDNLVKQLVHAIEQTNSEIIELKPQYAIEQFGTNINTYPELLQGIYSYSPTVFNTNNGKINQQKNNRQQTHQQQQQQWYNVVHGQRGSNATLQSEDLQRLQQQMPLNVNNATITNNPSSGSFPTMEMTSMQNNNFDVQTPINHKVQHPITDRKQTLPGEQQKAGFENVACFQNTSTFSTPLNSTSCETKPSQIEQKANPAIPNTLQPTVIHTQNYQNPNSALMPDNPSTAMPIGNVQYQANNGYTQQNVTVQAPTVQAPAVQATVIQATVAQATAARAIAAQGMAVQAPVVQATAAQGTTARGIAARGIAAQATVVQTSASQGAAARAIAAQGTVAQAMALQAPAVKATTAQAPVAQAHPVQSPAIQAPAAQARRVQAPAVTATSVKAPAVQARPLQAPAVQAPAFQAPAVQTLAAPVAGEEKQSSDPILVPIKNEFIMPDPKPNTCVSSKPSEKSNVRVCINRLKEKDASLMQQSIKQFVKKSPESARKFGLVTPNKVEPPAPTPTSASGDAQAPPSTDQKFQKLTTKAAENDDAFTLMKTNEKPLAMKRKLAPSVDEVPPEQIHSQPKLRCVERIVSTPSAKCTKDEILRSQTYQQFMRNLEQIIETLDDTEVPNFDTDDVDENIECISSRMLNIMSNDIAKLKAKYVLDVIPKTKLAQLVNYAMRNVYLAKNYSASPDDEDDIMDDEIMEKILNGIEACLLICNIYCTSKDIKFLQEDNIALIIKFMHFQFRETIFPSYDPVYTVKSMKKADNRKKSKIYQNYNRSLQLLYSKATELMKVFVTLFDRYIFVDTIILPLSTLSIEPFFVDNIETLQFVCLELVTTLFRKEEYVKIRSSILGDILTSIDRLPSSKKNLRPFKLINNSGNIQMVTALVLQLIQCVTILPDVMNSNSHNKRKSLPQYGELASQASSFSTQTDRQNIDVIVLKKYDVAISIGGNFLTTFLNKCKSRSNETDFRPIFENFIYDLLATVNKPEWPSSELLLSLLGTMLVRYVSDKSIEQSIRLVSLDYLGIVAARLRKDAVDSRYKVNVIDSMIRYIKVEQEKEGDLPSSNNKVELKEDERVEFLQKILLDFLAANAHVDNPIWDYARHFYLTQWYRDIIYQRRNINEGAKRDTSRKKSSRKRRTNADLSGSDSDDDSGDDINFVNVDSRVGGDCTMGNQELNMERFNLLDKRKQCLVNNINPYSTLGDSNHAQHIKTYIDYNNAHLIAQYLASKRPFSKSFDGYLKKIILVVNEPSIAIRTRAMKCLANIVEVDPMVLRRKDMQMGVNQKFLDAAISVREAAVDLVGKFVLSNEELIDQYYDMLSTRILDTGVSVRKRVIKILRDICIEYPTFQKIPEICVKMIRRVNDEEGIQKLVTEVFMKMWFTPLHKNDKDGIHLKINQIIDVVNIAHDTGTAWLEGLLNSIFQPKESNAKGDDSMKDNLQKKTEPPADILLSCQQLADGLVGRLIELEDTDNTRMLGCITTLHLLAKVRPQLLVQHAITIEPYLNIKCHPTTAPKFICAVADILEKVVPLVNNASESFLASLEEHLMLLVVSLNQAVVKSCVSCLGAIVNKITKNYALIRDCFQKFYRILDQTRNQILQNRQINNLSAAIRRSLFTIGILMRYFDFKSKEVIGESNSLSPTICNDVFDCLMFFAQYQNYDIRKEALIALGSFCVMNDDYLTNTKLKRYYCDLLLSETSDAGIKIICLRNIWIYLTESEMHMYNKEKDWDKQSKTEDLKEMNDVSSGMSSRIIQLYLQEIFECFLNSDDNVRLWAVKVIQIVLRQGLVHPVKTVPYLICLSTDSKLESAHRADALLKDIDKMYNGFVNMKAQLGLQFSFRLQRILQQNVKGKGSKVIRGYVKRNLDTMPTALNDFLYTLLRAVKTQRRALVQTIVKQFDDQKTSLQQMLYVADNLAYFPYAVQDEPLYLIHQVDLLISIVGTNLLTTFKENLKPSVNVGDVLEDDDDEDDPEVLFKRLPENAFEMQKCIMSSQACMLLLILKDHLKHMYSLTDSKISRYSPSEPKLYEKAVVRKTVQDFNPKTTIDIIKKQQETMLASDVANSKINLNDDERMDLVIKYLDFKKLMLKLDPDDEDSDDESRNKSKLNTTANTTQLNSSSASANKSTDDSCLDVDKSMNRENLT
ncbi:PREDICTED: nipped-B protein-like isoform X2 [Rhagoletis zephyria]|uniref:nipped-B protein-like isoform X2 n=1 Tax=Rhagoletis zephyria TaxID=28612 RepID=UPI00081146E4|nr:PREDICTED: nipped-B protein-like isoform X2 [Rhagoletis zephyria]